MRVIEKKLKIKYRIQKSGDRSEGDEGAISKTPIKIGRKLRMKESHRKDDPHHSGPARIEDVRQETASRTCLNPDEHRGWARDQWSILNSQCLNGLCSSFEGGRFLVLKSKRTSPSPSQSKMSSNERRFGIIFEEARRKRQFATHHSCDCSIKAMHRPLRLNFF
jgi:hypothetical protein